MVHLCPSQLRIELTGPCLLQHGHRHPTSCLIWLWKQYKHICGVLPPSQKSRLPWAITLMALFHPRELSSPDTGIETDLRRAAGIIIPLYDLDKFVTLRRALTVQGRLDFTSLSLPAVAWTVPAQSHVDMASYTLPIFISCSGISNAMQCNAERCKAKCKMIFKVHYMPVLKNSTEKENQQTTQNCIRVYFGEFAVAHIQSEHYGLSRYEIQNIFKVSWQCRLQVTVD